MARTSKHPRKSSPLNLPGAFELFTPSKDIVLKNIWIFGPLYAVPFIFWIHTWIWAPTPGKTTHHWWRGAANYSSGSPGGSLPTYSLAILVGFSLLWFFLITVFGTIVQIMSQAAQLDAAEGKALTFERLWATTKELGWRMAGLYIVTVLLIVLSLFTFTARYFLAPYVMLDKKVGIREALDQSAALSKNRRGSVWGIIGVTVLISLTNIIPIIGGLAAFAVGSLYSVAPALRYQQLKKLNQPA
jgi:hypothetical protein